MSKLMTGLHVLSQIIYTKKHLLLLRQIHCLTFKKKQDYIFYEAGWSPTRKATFTEKIRLQKTLKIFLNNIKILCVKFYVNTIYLKLFSLFVNEPFPVKMVGSIGFIDTIYSQYSRVCTINNVHCCLLQCFICKHHWGAPKFPILPAVLYPLGSPAVIISYIYHSVYRRLFSQVFVCLILK